ncbi:MAG: M20/M25/M40 family metallo-hydrolase [Kordiimonadaceae bacterium]|jgi:carboxypeptidase Q|nr:M20/M25/M40 family metallo-hydrolase [Kordiimonadaceae bacterium]MBT6035792.1 M20/M25/M40 family metallo-hydrolase [Kordiimonadaceae bacterium]MBT6329494.1 M20/M25/M40 family metallo-hydrolase [Kordiimonadaceae bacterium]MBT7581638.1 M20/M25/M40 family metallo-hydrolase [Kordiimonadaceae bacterium]
MKKLTMMALAGAMISFTASAQDSAVTDDMIEHANMLGQNALKSSLTEDIITSLTTEVGHRLAGTANDKKGREWAMAKMLAMGYDRVWEEPVTIPLWHRGSASVRITAPYQQNMAIVALGNSVRTPEGGLTAEVAQFDEYKDLVAAAPNSLNGKIAYVSLRMDGSGLKGYGYAGQARRNGSVAAAKAGASAIIIRSIGSDDNRTPHTGSMNYAEGVTQIPAAAISNPDADLLDNMLKYGEPVTIELNMTSHSHDPVVTYNVLGEITGTEEPEKAVMIGAHLDSWDLATGALDDGTGVSIMMSAGKHIIDGGIKPKRSIRVMLFAAEEEGLYGAHEYVRAHKEDHNDFGNTILGAEWDSGTGRIINIAPGVGPTSLNVVREMGAVFAPYGVSTLMTNTAKGQSDMSALGNAGMPAVNFGMEPTNYFDFHHTPNDTLDKVDMPAITHNAAIYAMFAWMAATVDVDYQK